MLRERTTLDWPLLVGLCAVTLDLLIGMPAQPRQPPPPPPPCRVTVAHVAPPPTPEDELERQYLVSYAIAFDNKAAPIDAFDALRRTRSLDLVLHDGARSDELTARMRVVAPRAVNAYRAMGDTAGAELARHTATLAGAP